MVAKGLLGGMIAAVALATVVPSIAQVPNPSGRTELPYDRGYDKSTPHGDAINGQEAPVTADLNNQVQAEVVGRQMSTAEAQSRYAADMMAYRRRVMADHRDAMSDARHYHRQQRAYAAAMADWRMQVSACEAGHSRACDMPTPNPADYY